MESLRAYNLRLLANILPLNVAEHFLKTQFKKDEVFGLLTFATEQDKADTYSHVVDDWICVLASSKLNNWVLVYFT